jgi:hypothetical protein
MEIIIIAICGICALLGYAEYKRGVRVGAETMLAMLTEQGFIKIDEEGNVSSGDRNV